MAGGTSDVTTLYSPAVGLIFVFNLIVGTGALTMPKALGETGWLLGLILLVALAFMSYMTVTFVIETMASANAMLRWRHLQRLKKHDNNAHDLHDRDDDGQLVVGEQDEKTPLLTGSGRINGDYYDITDKIEMGQMARLFFNKWGVWLFYLIIAIYLYGDLAIYAAAVPKSLRDVACTYRASCNSNGSGTNHTLVDSDPCWSGVQLTRINAYRIFVAVFILLLGPFIFFNVSKTKYLQIFTTVMRWLAFLMMITLALIRLGKGQGQGRPEVADFSGIPNFFGVCVYSFMCHHSLPSLVTPIRNKSKLGVMFAGDYFLIMCFYILLSFTGIFAFKRENLQDVYTLNFQYNPCDKGESAITNVQFIQYFLALFPVFTLSTNFPIIGITLRENIKTVFKREGGARNFYIDKLVFPIVTIVPPVVVALITQDVEFLVGITGSYAGSMIQYVVPAALVYYSRRDLALSLGTTMKNAHKSPFGHTFWLVFTVIWAIGCIAFVTANFFVKF